MRMMKYAYYTKLFEVFLVVCPALSIFSTAENINGRESMELCMPAGRCAILRTASKRAPARPTCDIFYLHDFIVVDEPRCKSHSRHSWLHRAGRWRDRKRWWGWRCWWRHCVVIATRRRKPLLDCRRRRSHRTDLEEFLAAFRIFFSFTFLPSPKRLCYIRCFFRLSVCLFGCNNYVAIVVLEVTLT